MSNAVSRIEKLAAQIAQMKAGRIRKETAARLDVKEHKDILEVIANLNEKKMRIIEQLTCVLDMHGRRMCSPKEKTENLLRGMMFARSWCNGERTKMYERKRAKVTRAIYNVIRENKQWIDELKRQILGGRHYC